MTPVEEATVQSVVTSVSTRMADPSFGQIAIGSFAQHHPDAGRFITAQHEQLGGSDGVVHAVFHAQVLNECFERHLGRALRPVTFRDLDAASGPAVVQRFDEAQPSLSSYVVSNVDDGKMREVLALVGLAMTAAG